MKTWTELDGVNAWTKFLDEFINGKPIAYSLVHLGAKKTKDGLKIEVLLKEGVRKDDIQHLPKVYKHPTGEYKVEIEEINRAELDRYHEEVLPLLFPNDTD